MANTAVCDRVCVCVCVYWWVPGKRWLSVCVLSSMRTSLYCFTVCLFVCGMEKMVGKRGEFSLSLSRGVCVLELLGWVNNSLSLRNRTNTRGMILIISCNSKSLFSLPMVVNIITNINIISKIVTGKAFVWKQPFLWLTHTRSGCDNVIAVTRDNGTNSVGGELPLPLRLRPLTFLPLSCALI